jgi:hypothetical protein
MTPQERTELEQAQRIRLQEINVEPGSRQDAESRHGQVWDSEELRRDFEVLAFCAPWTVGNWDRAMNAYKPKARAVEEQIDLALGYCNNSEYCPPEWVPRFEEMQNPDRLRLRREGKCLPRKAIPRNARGSRLSITNRCA